MRTDASTSKVKPKQLYIVLGAIAAIALALRIWAAHGALWLDEAWSAVFAHEAATPASVFFRINHDNNHHLNSLWMQLTGWGAPPLLTRSLSIITGTLTVIIAGLIGARHGLLEAALTAGLFAISPIMVNYSSEARGYAPMVLALVCAIWLIDRWLSDRSRPPPARMLGLVTMLGMLAHLTMLFGLAALAAWSLFSLIRTLPLRTAIHDFGVLMTRAVLGAFSILAIVTIAALGSPSGHFEVGSYTPYTGRILIEGVSLMFAYTVGIPPQAPPSIIMGILIILTLAAMCLLSPRDRLPFYAVAIFGLPLAVAILHIGNSGYPRYYLVTSVAYLLLLADASAIALRHATWQRLIAMLGLLAIGAGSVALNARLVAHSRGDPGPAIDAMIRRFPSGTTVLIGQLRDKAVIEAAAASYRYPVRITQDKCADAPFLFIEQASEAALPMQPEVCGDRYRAIARHGSAAALSGMAWHLYERVPPRNPSQAARRSSAARSTS